MRGPEYLNLNPDNPNNERFTGLKPGKLLVGSAVKWELSDITKMYVALQIHTSLLNQPKRMRVIPPVSLIESMNNSRFVLRLGEQDELLGSAQVWPLRQYSGVIEVGTWLGHKHEDYENGSGKLVMRHAAQLAMTLPGAEMAIALIHDENTKAREVMQKMGGIDMGYRFSEYVTEANGEPAKMHVFNLVNLTEK